MLLRILIASGDPELARRAQGAIADSELLCSSAADAAQLQAELAARPCDLLLLDEELLDGPTGVELEALRGRVGAPEVIVLLGDHAGGRRTEHVNRGALACLARDLPVETFTRTLATWVERVQGRAHRDLLALGNDLAPDTLPATSKSPLMQRFLVMARKVTDSNSSLLILGETGVGKEFLARSIHAQSGRRARPFIPVNCAALPEGLLESELFGHVAGAFTGANRPRRGFFELAHTGTLFLDEIADLPPHLQVKLLRVLQERQLQPVGSERLIEVDIRLIAATNRDLQVAMREGGFRSDLYYRLGVVTLTVPALRERKEDIPDLVQLQVERFGRELGRPVRGVSPAALELLEAYPWPGNVRELINVVERAVLLTDSAEIGPEDLPDELRDPHAPAGDLAEIRSDLLDLPLHEAREQVLAAFERRYLEQLLRATRGRVGETAERAGITPRTLYEKMKRFDLRKETFRALPRGDAPA